MRSSDVARLIALAAIWGSSFAFMRIVVPKLGAVQTVELRVLFAGLALLAYFRAIRTAVEWRRFWKQYFVIGFLNSALPFTLFALAARHLPASISAILNSSSPLFGALCAAIWLKEPLTRKRVLGLLLGAVGVTLVVGFSGFARLEADPWVGFSIVACLGAALCYALAGVYLKLRGAGIRPLAVAGASQIAAAVTLIFPTLLFAPGPGLSLGMALSNLPSLWMQVAALSLFCTGLAYVLYFRLIADIGPARALTVTFLVPVFGVLWGYLLLGEGITASMLLGCAFIILGTSLVVSRRA